MDHPLFQVQVMEFRKHHHQTMDRHPTHTEHLRRLLQSSTNMFTFTLHHQSQNIPQHHDLQQFCQPKNIIESSSLKPQHSLFPPCRHLLFKMTMKKKQLSMFWLRNPMSCLKSKQLQWLQRRQVNLKFISSATRLNKQRQHHQKLYQIRMDIIKNKGKYRQKVNEFWFFVAWKICISFYSSYHVQHHHVSAKFTFFFFFVFGTVNWSLPSANKLDPSPCLAVTCSVNHRILPSIIIRMSVPVHPYMMTNCASSITCQHLLKSHTRKHRNSYAELIDDRK